MPICVPSGSCTQIPPTRAKYAAFLVDFHTVRNAQFGTTQIGKDLPIACMTFRIDINRVDVLSRARIRDIERAFVGDNARPFGYSHVKIA